MASKPPQLDSYNTAMIRIAKAVLKSGEYRENTEGMIFSPRLVAERVEALIKREQRRKQRLTATVLGWTGD